MKYLIHGNSPFVSSGYGVQVALLSERLRDAGHDVAISSTFGQQGSAGSWRGLTVYPNGFEANGNDSLHLHASHHFGGDEHGGWIITLLDVWALVTPMLKDFNVAAWVPIDHLPIPPDVLKFFHRSGATPLAMSRFGDRLLRDAGLDPVYIPLSVDTSVYKPTPTIQGRTAREFLDIPEDAFVVGMVAMNKGWARDRKGFNEAFRAFGQFHKNHPEAILYLHTEKHGGATEGINLAELATHCSIPVHAIRWVDQYAYRMGCPPEMMAATYTAMDILLAPSHGEGFGVPLIEAQACGTPVIASDFSSQPELVGAGWLVSGQLEWDPAQHASYLCPFTAEVLARLEDAHASANLSEKAIEFASAYDSDRVFRDYWRPFLETLEPVAAAQPPYKRDPIFHEPNQVAVIVPAMRQANLPRLRASFDATNDGSARLVVVADLDSDIEAPDVLMEGQGPSSFAEKVNTGFVATEEPWVLLVGDDVEFTPGWLQAARALSDKFDVIGTNDTSGEVKNPDIAAGRHSDHSFFRRSYVDNLGASLDGPGIIASEAYGHWYVDMEQIGLAKARGVFTPCLDSVVEHLHPGFDGREDLRQSDPVYMRAVEHADADAKTFRSRLPLIEMQRVSRAKTR